MATLERIRAGFGCGFARLQRSHPRNRSRRDRSEGVVGGERFRTAPAARHRPSRCGRSPRSAAERRGDRGAAEPDPERSWCARTAAPGERRARRLALRRGAAGRHGGSPRRARRACDRPQRSRDRGGPPAAPATRRERSPDSEPGGMGRRVRGRRVACRGARHGRRREPRRVRRPRGRRGVLRPQRRLLRRVPQRLDLTDSGPAPPRPASSTAATTGPTSPASPSASIRWSAASRPRPV